MATGANATELQSACSSFANYVCGAPLSQAVALEVPGASGSAYVKRDSRFTAAIDISIPLDFDGAQPSAFHIPRARAWCFESGGFVGDTRRGSGCNCMTITMTPRGNGTHTEGVGHISDERHPVPRLVPPTFVPATLISVTPVNCRK